jgi:hypothetical protein
LAHGTCSFSFSDFLATTMNSSSNFGHVVMLGLALSRWTSLMEHGRTGITRSG